MMKFQSKTHCPKGHEFTPENTYMRKEGWKSCRICRNEASDRCRSNNPERAKEVAKGVRLRNREARNEYHRKYIKENPDKAKAHKQKRRAKKNQSGGYFTPEEWFILCFAVGFRCLCCGEKKPLEADHVVPISKGGTSWLWNIQPLCESCNAKKYNKYMDYRF